MDDPNADQAAFSQQYDAEQAQAKQAEDKQPPSFLQKWTAPVGRVSTSVLDRAVADADQMYNTDPEKRAERDIVAGGTTGAVNTVDAARSALFTSGKGLAAAEDPANADAAMQGTDPTSPVWDHARGAILDFRDAVAVKDPTLADNLTQGVAQLAIPFAGYSRALAGLHGIANAVAAGGIADATALAPHDGRTADLIALGRTTEGKLGDALRMLAPDGSAQNAYINFLADRGNETEAEGRFKNVLDGFGVNLITTPLMHAAGVVLKQGTNALRNAVSSGVSKFSDLLPPKAPAKEAPISQFQRDAVGVRGAQPPVTEGMTRLWRGNRVAGDEGNPSYTDSLEGIAMPFQKAYGGRLSFVDVPTAKLDSLRSGGPGTAATSAEYMLPDDYTKLARYAATDGKPIEHVMPDPNVEGMKTVLRERAVKTAAAKEK